MTSENKIQNTICNAFECEGALPACELQGFNSRLKNYYRLLFSLLCGFLLAVSSCGAQGIKGKVIAVKDGDTIELRADTATHRIRLNGIDCPETAQPFGQAAKRFAGDLCFGKQVSVVTHGRDRYGRIIGDVILEDGRILNRELVAAGLAWWYRKYSRDPVLELLESEARRARRGLWSDPDPVPPWDFRKRK